MAARLGARCLPLRPLTTLATPRLRLRASADGPVPAALSRFGVLLRICWAVRAADGGSAAARLRGAGGAGALLLAGSQAAFESLVAFVQVLHRTDALASPAATAGTACRDALISLHCALEFSRLRCNAAPEQQVPKPCVSACESIVELCAQSLGGGFDGSMCTVDNGYGAEGDCAALPRQVRVGCTSVTGWQRR